ncbi:MAG: pyruvate kinase alpha/beta domain-containing protein [Chloroflexota bacterium]|nr:pyruvate kinase alpha/beta domain-containing protein [Chloroflexota bacterium]
MSGVALETIYFEEPGPKNTTRTLEKAKQRADELDIDTILVASTRGRTGVQAAEVCRGYNVVVVSHSTGFKEPSVQQLTEDNRAAIEATGATVLTCQHAFGGVNRAVRKQLGTCLTDEIIAHTLRRFGEGTKVCVEIALMAVDAGLVTVGEPCIAIAGTGRGADTAIVLIPANAQQFFDMQIMEILAKPRLP